MDRYKSLSQAVSYRKLLCLYLLFLSFGPEDVAIIHGSENLPAVVPWEPGVLLFIFCW